LNKIPLVSAIVSTYNSEKFIRGKLDDLLEQTISDRLEIVIVNSGSLQNEDIVIKEYLNKYSNIKYIKTENRETIYKAWNRGIKISTGKYITNANTDDRLKINAFEILSSELEKNDDIALVFANQYISSIPNERYNEVKNKKKWVIPEFDYFEQLDRSIVLSQPMWRSSLHFVDDIWFDEKLEICGDHEFALHLQQIYEIKYIPSALGVFYFDNKRSNRSLQNMNVLEVEKLEVTKNYIKKYIDALNEDELDSIVNKYAFSIKLPIIFLRGKNIINLYKSPQKHPFTHEFVYYVMALTFQRLKQFEKAIYCCKKLLKRKKSRRVSELLQQIIH